MIRIRLFDLRAKKRIAALRDERGREIGSEKLLEVAFAGRKPVRGGRSIRPGEAPIGGPALSR
jgi:hypothetical protein